MIGNFNEHLDLHICNYSLINCYSKCFVARQLIFHLATAQNSHLVPSKEFHPISCFYAFIVGIFLSIFSDKKRILVSK